MKMKVAMMYGFNTVALTKRQEAEVAELKMLRFSLGVTRMMFLCLWGHLA